MANILLLLVDGFESATREDSDIAGGTGCVGRVMLTGRPAKRCLHDFTYEQRSDFCMYLVPPYEPFS